jgi:pre-rRNA-processing protein IPI1
VQPLIRDTSSNVRTQLLKLLVALPPEDVRSNAEQILLWTRLGLTHLSGGIRLSSLDVLEWLLNTAGNEAVTCPGGWSKTLKCFAGLLGWDSTQTTLANGIRASSVKASGGGTWTSTPSSAGKSTSDIKILTKTLSVLTLFLEAGLLPTLAEKQAMKIQAERARGNFPLWHADQHLLPKVSNPFGYMNLFGAPRDDEGMEYEDRADRIRYFDEKWRVTFKHGVDRVKRDGGGVGRVAVGVEKLLDAR